MNYSVQFKKVLEGIASKSGDLSVEEKEDISTAVDSLIAGIKEEIEQDGWEDDNGEISVG